MATISDTIRVVLQNRQGVMLDEEVRAITSKNDKGIFDVLPEHAHFISLIQESVTVHKKNGETKTFSIENAILRVYNNTAYIFIGLTQATKTQESAKLP